MVRYNPLQEYILCINTIVCSIRARFDYVLFQERAVIACVLHETAMTVCSFRSAN